MSLVQFCDMCDNLLFFKTIATDLKLHCRICDSITDYEYKAKPIIKRDYTNSYLSAKATTNPDIIHDPAIPRIRGAEIPCPISTCPSKSPSVENEVLYIKYDAENLKFMYICKHCKHTWNNA